MTGAAAVDTGLFIMSDRQPIEESIEKCFGTTHQDINGKRSFKTPLGLPAEKTQQKPNLDNF